MSKLFLLHDKGSKKPTPVYLWYRKQHAGHKIFLKYPTGITVLPSNWNPAKQRIKEQITIKHYEADNRRLNEIEKAFRNTVDRISFFDLDSEQLRSEIDIAIGIKPKDETLTLYGFIWSYYQDKLARDGFEKAKQYQTMLNNLKRFDPMQKLTFEKIDAKFLEDFTRFLCREREVRLKNGDLKTKQGYAKNALGKTISVLKIVLANAARRGINRNMSFREFKRQQEDVYNIYLSQDEIQALYNHHFTGYKEKARDLFIIGCCTGMRAENYLSIDPDIQIDLGKGFIQAIVNKNGPRIEIPVHWMIREILEKYNGFPETISQQKLNKYIKECARDAGINSMVVYAKTIGGKRKEFTKEKWEMVTTHTARRSLVTNLYLQGAKLKYIMGITGHKTEAQCLKYIKASVNEVAPEIALLPFWKKQ